MSKDDIIVNIPTQTQMETYSNVHKEKDCNASLENAQTPSTKNIAIIQYNLKSFNTRGHTHLHVLCLRHW